jgi:anaerobic magnesium-protoporphyrin IX monomethyl ester cyclase
LAAALESAGHKVQVHDLGLDPHLPLTEGIDRICTFDPQLIGITAMTSVYQSAIETAVQLKARLGRPIVLGGPHATMFPEEVLAEAPILDYVVRGEGEETLLELVEELEGRSGNVSAIRGLTHRQGDRIVSNPDRPLIDDLDSLAFPARHLFELERYGLRTPDGRPMLTLLSSRGCPYNCAYCFKGIVGRTYRQRSPENIVSELGQVIEEYGVRDFYFVDDLFTLNTRRLDALIDLMAAEGLAVRWQCLGRVDRVDARILKRMYAAGCRRIHFGIESGNQRLLERIGKGFRLEQVRDAVRWAQDAGIHVKGYFMLGLPGDTAETMQQTVDFAVELGLDEAMFSVTTPFPGTRLWDELVAKRPQTKYDQDFTRAYYYGGVAEEDAPFLNVSEVSDAELGRWLGKARKALVDERARRVYLEAFGRLLGPVLWRISRVGPLRSLARGLLRLRPFQRFVVLRKRNASSWS